MSVLIPEVYCEDLEITRVFYVETLGFSIRYQRPEDEFVRFTFHGADIMVEALHGAGRRWLTGPMQRPFGRGVNLQWEVPDLHQLYARVQARSPAAIFLDLETRDYRCGEHTLTQQQFIVQDPNGYLLRFCQNLSVE